MELSLVLTGQNSDEYTSDSVYCMDVEVFLELLPLRVWKKVYIHASFEELAGFYTLSEVIGHIYNAKIPWLYIEGYSNEFLQGLKDQPPKGFNFGHLWTFPRKNGGICFYRA